MTTLLDAFMLLKGYNLREEKKQLDRLTVVPAHVELTG